MKNKDWENYIQRLMEEIHEESDVSPTEGGSLKADASGHPPIDPNVAGDQLLREALSNYTPDGPVQGWESIESAIHATDRKFDNEVRDKIHNYKAPNDPHSWSKFIQQFAAYKTYRLKIIALKLGEAVSILLLLFTTLQFHNADSFPWQTPPPQVVPEQKQIITTKSPSIAQHIETENILIEATPSTSKQRPAINKADTQQSISSSPPTADNKPAIAAMSVVLSDDAITSNDIPSPLHEDAILSAHDNPSNASSSIDDAEAITTTPSIENRNLTAESYITTTLPLSNPSLSETRQSAIPALTYVKPAARSFLEFGMFAQADYNQLKMPQDILFSNGKQVVFPLQGITSAGYGAGFTLALRQSRGALETGLTYSSKTFRPNRKLTVGESTDHSTVDFESMHIQFVSVPLEYRYQITPSRRFNAYVLGGFALHVIAQSDVDVVVKHSFASLSPGENPNSNPELVRNIRASKQLSEDFRDGAPFSTKSHISANIGLGIEYRLTKQKTLFLQSAYQYQIPNLRFSNHNGKHLLSVSLQAGVRTPL